MNILIVGEKATDVFIYGEASRLNPEAPTPVLNFKRETVNPGMAGNVSANIHSLRPDYIVDEIYQFTPIKKTRFVDETSGYILLRLDDDATEAVFPLTNEAWERVNLQNYSAVVVSDYCKGFLSNELLARICNDAHNAGVSIFLDTKKLLGRWSEDVDFVKINKKEFLYNEQNLKLPPENYCKNLILTLGQEGSQWRKRGSSIRHSAGIPVDAHCLSGAGDSYLAGFVVKYIETLSVMGAMDYANKVAQVAVSKRGVVAVKAEEIV